jgi:hypothetical protein
MKASHKALLTAIAIKVRARRQSKKPLLVFHGDTTLPATSPEELEAARLAGRPIVNIHFIRPENGPNSALSPSESREGSEV